MRAASFSFVVASIVAVVVGAPTRAQTRPPQPIGSPSTADDCRYFLPVIPTTDGPPPEDAPPGSLPDQPAFGSVVIASPPAAVGPVPRNVELALGGAIAEVDQGLWDIRLDGPIAPIPFERDGARIVPVGGLLPPGIVTLTLEANAAHPCQGCSLPARLTLQVTDDVDVTPPTITDLVVHELVPPPVEQQTACNFFAGTGDFLELAVTTDEDAFVAFGARHALLAPRGVFAAAARGNFRADTNISLASTPIVAVGDDVIVAGFARDLAGNVSPALVTRVRARSMLTVVSPDTTIDELPEQRCSLDGAPEVHLPAQLPRNPSLRVLFPFEELPLALRRGDEFVALVPGADVVEDARAGRLFAPAQPVDAGAWELVSLPCTRCVCPQCTSPLRMPVTLVDVVDTTPPAAPVVRGLLDDAAPARSGGRCVPDHAATLAVLAPGDDDVSGTLDFTYDVVVRLGTDPPRPVGVGLAPLQRADGDVVLRLPTAPFGRIVDDDMTLEITARDAAGNTTTATWTQSRDDAGGCAATGGGEVLVLGGLVLARRRRR
jgi:hypothetical protein